MSGRGVGSIITAGAEAAKRTRLERIVSHLALCVASTSGARSLLEEETFLDSQEAASLKEISR